MLRNYLTIAFRNLKRYPGFSFINLFGLSIGMTACLLILLFVTHERGFDQFHEKSDRIYRLDEVQTWDGIIPQNVALSMYPMGPTLIQDFPEVEAFTRMLSRDEVPLDLGDSRIYLEKLYIADSAFFEIFDFPWKYGNKAEAMKTPNSIVLTEESAVKFFGDADAAMGKELMMRGGDTTYLTIGGIIENVPEQSHLQFDGLISMATISSEDQAQMMENWGSNWLNTYLLLQPNTDIAAMEARFPDYLTKYMGENATDGYQLFLQSLNDIHLGSTNITHDYQNFRKFDGSYISIFSFLALFVLLIAAINFMNLSTARSAKRAREVGVRKTIGAQRGQLAGQFLTESVMFAVFSLLVALGATALVVPWMNEFSHRSISFFTLFKPAFLSLILGTTLLVGLLSGVYPALFISRFNPMTIFKGGKLFNNSKFSLQNVLVVFQFGLATILIIGTLLTAQQLSYMTNKDPGFNKDQVILLPTDGSVNESYTTVRQEISQIASVQGVTASRQRLGNNIHQTGIEFQDDTATQSLAISHLSVDFNYIDFYEIELLEGRAFSPEYSQDSGRAFIINEELASRIGWENPVGKPFKFGWQEEWGTVIGLAKDFNYNSLHHDINPLAMSVQPWGYSEISVRIDPKELPSRIAAIETAWRSSGTDLPFEYEFLDTHFAEIYEGDQQASVIVRIVAFLAILIACMGLFGLITISAERRTKEVGIRKVLGASVSQIMVMFARNIAWLVLIAIVIAVPVSWWAMSSWLENYADRIEIGPTVFILAGLGAMAIAMITISFRTYRAALANMVESLRTE